VAFGADAVPAEALGSLMHLVFGTGENDHVRSLAAELLGKGEAQPLGPAGDDNRLTLEGLFGSCHDLLRAFIRTSLGGAPSTPDSTKVGSRQEAITNRISASFLRRVTLLA
jgi:hypothetical protein